MRAALSRREAQVLRLPVVPIKEPTYPPITEIDVRKATPPPLFQVSGTSFRRFRRTSLEGRVFLPAQRWCLELGRA